MKRLISILVILAIGIALGISIKSVRPPSSSETVPAKSAHVTIYQCAMHPWIRSEKPGRCTICGMELTPTSDDDIAATGNSITLSQNQIHVINVQTVTAEVQPLTKTFQVAGMIDDNATRHRLLSAYVDGRVDKLYVNYPGLDVTEDQPLVELYSPPLLQTEQEYRQTSGDFRTNVAARLRQMGLRQSQIDALDAKSPDVITTQILSPIAGTVVSQHVYEGQYVKAGDNLLEIGDFSTMWFIFSAYEQDLPWIQLGQTVTVTTPSQPGKLYTGKVTFIDPNVEDMTRSTQVRVELPNPLVNGRRELLHRLYADASIATETPAVLVVPKSAVLTTGPESVVYVDKGGGNYERRVVTLGRGGDSLVEILTGVQANEPVVVNGNLLIDGQAEMNRSFALPTSESTPAATVATATVSPAPTADELSSLILLADALATALAHDDLAAFNLAVGAGMTQITVPPPGTATDISAARKEFLTFIQATTSVVEPLRGRAGTPPFSVWECPMVSSAIPGAPAKVRWIQTGSRPPANPFFGNEMPDCATEIKP